MCAKFARFTSAANCSSAASARALGGGDVEPAEPTRFLAAGPKRCIARPQAPHIAGAAPGFERGGHVALQRVGQRHMLFVVPAFEQRQALPRDRAQKIVGGIGEEPHAIDDELGAHVLERDAAAGERSQNLLGLADALLDRVAGAAMVAEGVHRGGRHGVDRVAADQRLDVMHVAVSLVLGAGAGPQEPLRPGAAIGELLPARARENALVALIGELGVGDRDLAGERGERVVAPLGDEAVDHGVDAADEEARDAREPASDRRRPPRISPSPRDRLPPLSRTWPARRAA